MCRKLFISVIFFLSVAAKGQNIQYQFSHLDISKGLSHNHVTAIFKDKRGFMWFGTITGLNRYDGFKFKVYKHKLKDSTSLKEDVIESIQEGPEGKLWIDTRLGYTIYDPITEQFDQDIQGCLRSLSIPWKDISSFIKDKAGDFWFLNSGKGICRYKTKTKEIQLFYKGNNSKYPLYSNLVTNIAENSNGDIWVIYNDGTLEKINSLNSKISFRSDVIKKQNTGISNFAFSVDKEDDLWIFSSFGASGVYYYSPSKTIVKHFASNAQDKLNADIVNKVLQDDKGLIWIGTDHGGVNLISKKDFKVRYLVHGEDDRKSLAQNSIVTMYKDDSGIIWIGTYKRGISYYHENIIKFPLIRHHTSDPNSLKYDDVNRFVEDDAGNLWIGTNGGGLLYFNRKKNTFQQYRHNSANKNSLGNDVVVSLCIDHEKKLWIGTYYGGLDCFDGKTFKHYKHNENNPFSLSDDRVWEIMEDSQKRLWVGTLSGGVNLFDPQKQSFTRFGLGKNQLNSLYISSILEDRAGNIWFGTSQGVDILMKKTNKFSHLGHSDSNPNSLIHNNISNMLIDSRGLIWVSTRDGVSMFNPISRKFRTFQKEDGLPDNIVIDIQEDNNHNLWLSTASGLSNLILSRNRNGDLNFKFKNYDEIDGLQGLEFNESASLKTRRGELIFGGANGFNIFDPKTIRSNNSQPLLVLTDFQVFNNSLKPGDEIDGHKILSKSITESKSVTLKHNENVFSLEFAALYFFNTDKVKLQYMLEGFDKNWLNADIKVRKATYTNLDAGTYTFKIRATNEDGTYGDKILKLEIVVLPPFWQTPLAYIFYFSVMAFLLYSIRRRGIRKIKTQFAIEQERQEAKRMHELDMMKIKFFTNVSHEFRTPLSLILAPVEKIIKQTDEPEQLRQLQMINRNARRLLNLVNQLLDFRKMEVQELKLHPKPGDLIRFIKEVTQSFSDIGDKKNIGFVFDSECDSLETRFDHDKIERILFNLLSNAFKFTHQGGHISVLVNIIESGQQPNLEIKVIDTGIGIPKEKQDKIFERFFQNDVPGTMVNQGSGIGLSITKEFIKLHGGEITVESIPGEGSCFIVLIPIKTYNKSSDDLHAENNQSKITSPAQDNRAGKKQTVLLVEDNEDFRFYLKDNLRESFHIIEAANGKEGWQKALSLHPNLVVSDISMPEMDGIALCRKLKSDNRTSHIPVVLLTALTGEEQHLKGLETGATDYMTKPFNFEILLSKIKNILLQQESMRKTYQKQVEIKPSDVIVESPDEVFIQKALTVVEKNISNPDFSVEELSSEMNMSRVTLYKKVLSITGKTPVEFIRSVRIKRSAQLLEKGHLTISQIGYKVGFKSQKYFVRSFKAEFNMLPSAYIGEHKMAEIKD